MFARSSQLVLALSFALPAAAVAQGFVYAPGASQYRITQKTKAAQEAMGQKQEFESSSNQLLSVTIERPVKDTMGMTVVLDSIVSMGPMGPTPGLDKLMGMKIVAKLSPFGVYYSSVAPKDDSIPNAASLAEAMGSFLPRIRGTLAKGTTWTDTTTGRAKQGGIDVDRRVITKTTVAGDTVVAGEKGWKLDRETTTTLSGSGTAQGQPMTMEGSSTGKGALFITQKGVFVGGEGSEDASIKILLAANGMEIGVTTSTATKVEKVK